MPKFSQPLAISPSSRRPRRIVTVSGRGVRGTFPTRKSERPAQFESLNEAMALLILEVAASVKSIATQPQVFEYLHDECRRRYTPDVKVETDTGPAFLEIKDDKALATHSQAIIRLKAAMQHLRQHGHRFCIVLRSDLIADDLPNRLQLLLSVRPARGRYRPSLNTALWDPEYGTSPSNEISEKWENAKRECDDLLRRVMKRDPDDLLPALVR
ncbi:TnsA endonuclease N-terminal domain-containing protein [Paraburkholderia sp. J7]|uniref:TnsA endonuclease N-terminal domain-containing protein n=1 Tax=Paraburkholderia sp. J7 TaxID=2805438 RepID=UPI002AB618A3|nr:TnsA endonuclease N-terminal domain-containing protein [Paraburkholderia sp. J7]